MRGMPKPISIFDSLSMSMSRHLIVLVRDFEFPNSSILRHSIERSLPNPNQNPKSINGSNF